MGIFRTNVTADPSDFGPSDTAPMPEPIQRGPRRIENGTDQQESLWADLIDSTTNVLVEARAGCGKSSSCREGMWRALGVNPHQSIRYAVYNKTNADEFRGDCPAGVDVATVHSFGYAALRSTFGCVMDKMKTYSILDERADSKAAARWLRKAVSMIVSQAKNQLLRGDEPDLDESLSAIILHYDIQVCNRQYDAIKFAKFALARSAEITSVVDFDDMIWLPAVHQVAFPPCDLLFLDEVQDWNPAQHALIPLMCRAGRVVAVGDSYQAIYAWRGADPESMTRLGADLESRGGLTRLPLNLTFRCPQSHVRRAQEYVADIHAHPSNREGTIEELDSERALAATTPGDMVICYKNAPLVSAALQLIAQRRKAFVRGRALGDQLIGIVRSVGQGAVTTGQLSDAVRKWQSREVGRLAEMENVDDLIESVMDRAAGLMAIVAGCAQPNEVEPAIAALFSENAKPGSGAVLFSTIHRAKGLEADHIYILETEERPAKQSWEADQQRNLRYVALTRSKSILTLVESE